MTEKCRHADAYKATRAPTCGCHACAVKWALATQQAAVLHEVEGCIDAAQDVLGRDGVVALQTLRSRLKEQFLKP